MSSLFVKMVSFYLKSCKNTSVNNVEQVSEEYQENNKMNIYLECNGYEKHSSKKNVSSNTCVQCL